MFYPLSSSVEIMLTHSDIDCQDMIKYMRKRVDMLYDSGFSYFSPSSFCSSELSVCLYPVYPSVRRNA